MLGYTPLVALDSPAADAEGAFLIAASAVLVVVAFVTLILGIFRSGLELIWVSIGSSILAAIFLLLGVVQTRPKVAVAGGPQSATTPGGAGPWSQPGAGTAVLDRPEPEAAEPEPEPAPEVLPQVVAERTPPRGTAARGAAAKPAPKPRTSAAEVTVVVIPDRDKFHKDSCRYAKSPAAMTMPKGAARKEGYKPCGICKP